MTSGAAGCDVAPVPGDKARKWKVASDSVYLECLQVSGRWRTAAPRFRKDASRRESLRAEIFQCDLQTQPSRKRRVGIPESCYHG